MLAYLICCIAILDGRSCRRYNKHISRGLYYVFTTLFVVILFACSPVPTDAQENTHKQSSVKIKGISFVSPPQPLKNSEIDQLNRVSPNYLAIMPFGFLRDKNKPVLRYSYDGQWWGEGPEGVKKMIDSCHTRGYKIMLKPQLWIAHGVFTGLIEMNSDEDWKILEKHYTDYILNYAEIAEDTKAEMLCIGTELGKWVKQRPEYWKGLISEVKKVYSGHLTYAENWDCFDEVPFLSELDFIGVDAYFPLIDEESPSKESLANAWEKHVKRMKRCSDQCEKPILLTEIGYRSAVGAAAKPWDYSEKGVPDQDLQALLYEVMFEKVFSLDFVAGAFIWKWFPDESRLNPENTGYTPQKKEAEKVLKNWYGKF